MLSSSVIKNIDQASHYYSEKDNYYMKDEGNKKSEWFGKGAKDFALYNAIDENQFTQLLKGKLPTGQQLGTVIDGEMKHRAGWDLTFSAPKSVSLMALIGEDKRLLEAHHEAVISTLSHVEHGFTQARVKRNGSMEYQNTNNMTVALFHHDLSRSQDPQLHTHSIVFNMTKRNDGEWRSMASQRGKYSENIEGEINGFIERVRHHNRYLSKLYEAELAFRVKQLGYNIRTNTESGIFEIEGVTQEAIDLFSKRRAQIEKSVSEKGFSGGKANAVATLNTRMHKQTVDRKTLQEKWKAEAKKLGFDYQGIVDRTKDSITNFSKEVSSIKETDKHVGSLVEKASNALSIFKTTFTYEELVSESIQHAIQDDINPHRLLETINLHIENESLLSFQNKDGKTLLMSKSTLEDEKRLIHFLKNNLSDKKVISEDHVNNFLTQHEEIDSSLHSPIKSTFNQDRMVLIEGDSKTMLLEPIVNLIKSAHLDMAILSPSQIGSKKIAQELKPETNTFWGKMKSLFIDNTPKHYSVMQFLNTFQHSTHHPDVLIVDNAHLLSTYQKARLLEWNAKYNSKLILLGDKEKLLPLQQGVSIEMFKENGIQFITVPHAEINDQPNLFIQSINKIGHRFIESYNKEDRYEGMAKQFASLDIGERKKSWLIGQNKEANNILNGLVHDTLKSQDQLGKIIEATLLIPQYVSSDKAKVAKSFNENQILRFNQTLRSLKIEQGEYLKIKSINLSSNSILLEKKNKCLIHWYPDKLGFNHVECFNEEKKELAIGETIIFQRSIKSQKIAKGERFTIENIRQDKIQLTNDHRKSVVLDLNKPFHTHFDYGYASNIHAIAHEKSDNLIVDLPSKSFSTNKRSINQIANQSSNTWVHTDNLKVFTHTLQKQTGDKESALTILNHAQKLKSHLHVIYDIVEKEIGIGTQNKNIFKKAIDAVDYAIRHLSEREAGFTHKNLLQTALKYTMGEVNQLTLSKVIKVMQDQSILHIGKRNDGTLWTTAEAVKLERDILSLCHQDKNKFEPLIDRERVISYLSNKELKPEQANAILNITQNKDRILPIQGYAGTGKTTMMIALDDVLTSKALLNDHGYELLCIAPTNKAVKELIARNIKAQTIDSFLLEIRREESNQYDFRKTVLVIDEASMVSNKKMQKILSIVHEKEFRQMVPTGDTKQNPAIESGKPFDLIQTHLNETTTYLRDIQRQKNGVLQDTVKAIYNDQTKKAFNILDH